jgi:hypothetical protein
MAFVSKSSLRFSRARCRRRRIRRHPQESLYRIRSPQFILKWLELDDETVLRFIDCCWLRGFCQDEKERLQGEESSVI